MNVYLIGYRGTGKSTIAPLVASLLSSRTNQGWPSVDLDVEIEHDAGRSIAEIFREEGEPGFRKRESNALRQMAAQSNQVVATGGGVVLFEVNRSLLSKGWVVWLTATPETIWLRMQGDQTTAARRPNLTARGGLEEIETLLEQRRPHYQSLAQLTLSTDDISAAQISEMIVSSVQEQLARGAS